MTDAGLATYCYRHPDRASGIVCTRCRRPICPECMVDAPVGFQCPDCARQGIRETRQGELAYGGRLSRDPRLTTFALIAANVLVWLAITATGGGRSRLVDALALIPRGICMSADDSGSYYPGATLERCAAIPGVWDAGVAHGAVWQVVTSAFTQVALLHLAVNMVSLYILGPLLERVLGRGRFLAVYGIAALGGSAVVMWLSAPDSQTVGASGALFGLMGAVFVVAIKHRGNVRQVLLLLGLNVVITVLNPDTISWQGHLGGLLAGAAAMLVLIAAPRQRRDAVQAAGLAGLTAVLVGVIAIRIFMLA